MNKKSLSILVLSSLFLLGCKSNDQTASANESGYRCEQVRALGSNIPIKYCSSKKERDEARKRGKEQLRTSQRVGVITGGLKEGG